MKKTAVDLYQQHFVDKQFERLDLFQILAEQYGIERVLYPGSFVHITPSFVFPDVVYVDSDKRAQRFFTSQEVLDFVAQRKSYPQEAKVAFYAADYREGFAEPVASFDLLISQYAGFVGQACKAYLQPGGWLLANNSHGDAGVAALDGDYVLKAAVFLRQGQYCLSDQNLDAYFLPKSSQVSLTQEYLLELGKGIGYTKTATAYLFQRI
ncbi:MAG: hypothetical protein H6658_08180 [Ardenticatenaceae bacterium]|nr:hypothetical protein [Ardenticatenaceae bacterium]